MFFSTLQSQIMRSVIKLNSQKNRNLMKNSTSHKIDFNKYEKLMKAL